MTSWQPILPSPAAVGGFSPTPQLETYDKSNWIISPRIGVKKNIWNHHLVTCISSISWMVFGPPQSSWKNAASTWNCFFPPGKIRWRCSGWTLSATWWAWMEERHFLARNFYIFRSLNLFWGPQCRQDPKGRIFCSPYSWYLRYVCFARSDEISDNETTNLNEKHILVNDGKPATSKGCQLNAKGWWIETL